MLSIFGVFKAKYKILQLYPNGYSFFYGKIQSFANVPKRPFVFSQQNTKFRASPERPFVFFTTKHNILKTAHKQPFVFYNKIENFESCTQTAIRISHKEIRNLTTYRQFSFVSSKQKKI